jgi:hypothetical protein
MQNQKNYTTESLSKIGIRMLPDNLKSDIEDAIEQMADSQHVAIVGVYFKEAIVDVRVISLTDPNSMRRGGPARLFHSVGEVAELLQ